ncbi:MAG: electron transfer flavoprotein subunit beta/FixA family protein [Dehalococcoidia bacterium]
MNMIVCCKQVLDPEAAPSTFKLDAANNRMVQPPEIKPVVNPYDEQAVEAALRIKDKDKAANKVTIICLGNNLVRDVVKKPLSMGADELILLEDPAFEGGDSFCGRQESEWDDGQVGSGLAELLGIPSVTVAKKAEVVDGGKVKVERVVADGFQVLEVSTPALITVSNELGEARYATLKGIMAASKKQPIVWKPADIGVDKVGAAARKSKIVKLFQPVEEGKCDIVSADSPAEAASLLAQKLRENKVI